MAAWSSLIFALRPNADATERSRLKPKLTPSSMRSSSSRLLVKMAPPSPIPNGLVAWKDTISTSPCVPTGVQSLASAPNAAAESTTSGTPSRRQASSQRMRVSVAGGVPNVDTANTIPTLSPA